MAARIDAAKAIIEWQGSICGLLKLDLKSGVTLADSDRPVKAVQAC